MQFSFSDEERLLQDSVRRLCDARCGSGEVRRAMESAEGHDPALWSALMSEMGLGAIALPEEDGGAGMGQVGLAIVLMELGRVLAPSPYLSSIAIGAEAVRRMGTKAQQAEFLPPIIGGEMIVALASRGTQRALVTEVTLDDGLRLNGDAGFVPYGHVAGLLIVAAQRANGSKALAVVKPTADGVSVERHVSLDLTRPLSTVRFRDVALSPDDLLGGDLDAAPHLDIILDLARIGLAAEQAGGAEAVLDMTVTYSKDRVQFGRPIGSFQALKHRMADMMVEVETAKTAAFYGAAIVDQGTEALAEAASIASSYCSDAFLSCAGNAIQLHGGIGFTWEHDAHLYFKRARADALLLGAPAAQRERLAAMIGVEWTA